MLQDPPHVDRAWLEQRLRAQGRALPGGTPVLEPIGRFSTEVWRIRLGEGPHLIVKRPYQAPRTGEPTALEGEFYQRAGQALPVATPRFVGRHGELLVLEEVAGLEPFDFAEGPAPGHAERAMDALAALHARYWERTDGLDFVPDVADRELRTAWQADFDAGWRRNRAQLRDACPAFAAIGDALVGRLAETLAPLSSPPTLLHGDAHAENLPLAPGGAVCFLDWQAPRLGCAAFDVAVFNAMSHPTEMRRRREEALVRRHADALGAQGIAWGEPWEAYRLGLLRRAARIVEISAAGDFAWLPWVFRRCAAAAADHAGGELVR